MQLRSQTLCYNAIVILVLHGTASLAAQPPSGPSGTSQQVTLDMTRGGGRPLVVVRAGATEGTVILDTGAGSAVFLDSFAEAVGARILGPTTLASPLGDTPLEGNTVAIEDLRVGSWELGAVRGTAIADDAFPLPGDALGVLPVNLLYRDHGVEIDLAAGTLSLTDAPTLPVAEWTSRRPEDDVLVAKVEIGSLRVEAHIDTGNAGGLLLPSRYAKSLGLEDQLVAAGAFRTIDAERQLSRAAYHGTLRVAGVELPVDEVHFADVPVANLGGGPLSGYVLVWERGGARFALRESTVGPSPTPQRRATRNAAPPPRLGLMAHPSLEAIEVVDTEPGSRARQAGLRAGDRIVAIDGVAVAEIAPRDRRGVLAGARVLTVERNSDEVEIALPSTTDP